MPDRIHFLRWQLNNHPAATNTPADLAAARAYLEREAPDLIDVILGGAE